MTDAAISEEEEFEFIRMRMQTQKLADQTGGQMSYDEASKTDVAAELGRSVGRGAGYAAEFLGDIGDVARASVDQWIPGLTPGETGDDKIWDQLNPFEPPDTGDLSRMKLVEDTGLDKLGEEKIRRGDSAWLDAGKTALEYVVPTLTGGGVGLTKTLGKNAVQSVGKLARNVAAPSLGAAGGEYVGNQVNETGGTIGEVVGALTGGVTSRKVGDLGRGMLAKYFNKAKKDLSNAELDGAIEAIMRQADDPEAARASFLAAIERGDEGTIADLMGDAGIYNVEELAQKGSLAERGIQEAQALRQAQMAERVGDVVGAGVPERLPGLAQAAQDKGVSRLNQGRIAAQNRAEGEVIDAAQAAASRRNVLLDTPVSEQSTKLAATYQNLDKSMRKRDVQPLWDKFDAEPDIKTPDMDAALENVLSQFDTIDEIPIRREFADEIKAIKSLGDTTSPSTIHKIISRTKAKAADRTKDASNYQREMDIVMGNLESMLENSTAGSAYTKARNADRAHRQRVSPGGVGKARSKTRADPELLMSTLSKNLEKGAVTADEILAAKSPAVTKVFKDTMRAMAHRADASDGLEGFLNTHKELLSRFPALRDDLTDLSGAQDTAKQAAKGLAQARKAAVTQAQAGRTRLSARLIQGMTDKPKATVDNILKSETAAKDMKQLMRTFGKTTEGKASMKKHVVDRFLATAKRQGDTIDPNIVKEFKRVRASLEESKLLTADEADTIATVLGMTGATKLRKAAGQQPHTALTRDQRLVTSALAALAMKFIPGNSLIMAGATKQFMKDQLLKSPDPRVLNALEDMTKNPRKFKEALEKFNPQDGKGMRAMLNAILKDTIHISTGVVLPPAIVGMGGKED